MRLILVLLCFLSSHHLFAQDKEEALAAQYYQNGEFEKAVDLYERLIKGKENNQYIYQNYLNCLVNLARFEEAEKFLKKQIKREPNDYRAAVDLIWIYDKQGNPDKRDKSLAELIQSVKGYAVADKIWPPLKLRGYNTAALEVMLKARKEEKTKDLFARELMSLYGELGKDDELINEGLTWLESMPNDADLINQQFARYLDDDTKLDKLRKTVSTQLQRRPDQEELNELLMWVLVQQKRFVAAVPQFKAMDKRRKEQGQRLMELAKVCIQYGAFEEAAACFDYVKGIGASSPFYYGAIWGLLELRFTQITQYRQFTSQTLEQARLAYTDFLSKYSSYYETSGAERQLAYLYNFYLNKPDSAIAILQSLSNRPRLTPRIIAEIKLELADAYLMQGEVWDAELTYSQVDKEFKEDFLGREAKYRMARLFYYKGDFERAAAYLDILKTSTSQFTSNDALELNLLITDNTGLDSTEEALMRFAEADLLLYQNKIVEGWRKLDSLQQLFPGHTLTDDVLMARAKALIKQQLYDSAIVFLNQIVVMHAQDVLADNALMEMAIIYEQNLKLPKKALETYEKLILNYPGSLFSTEARKAYRRLRGDQPDQKPNNQILFERFTN